MTKNIKNILVAVLVVLTGIVCLSWEAHKEYYSLNQVEYSPTSQTFQIRMIFFTDDVEYALNREYQAHVELDTEREDTLSTVYLERYLRKHFGIIVNDNPLTYNLLGRKYVKDQIYVYIETARTEIPRKINIRDTFLTDFFPEQQNIIKINVQGEWRSMILNAITPESEVLLEE
jgi:hypothetical protein